MRNTQYNFIESSAEEVLSELISKYESVTGHVLNPADPERLFLSWIADVIIHERVNINYVGNQNIPSRAVGENLDALGQWIFGIERKDARPAHCTVRFTISEAQTSAVSIPKGTRVSDANQTLVWETTEDSLVAIGETYADVEVSCVTAGTVGNGYSIGKINKLIDIDNILYYTSCSNVTVSDGGSDAEDDETYFEMMRAAADSYSTAGAKGAYEYWAKSVSDEIGDIKAVCPIISKEKTLPVYTDGEAKYAFLGGDHIDLSSLKVYAHSGGELAEAETDYTVEYDDGLIVISILEDGALESEEQIDVEILQDLAGHVYLFAIMRDGTIATSTIKNAIFEACNTDNVRPLTDYLSVEDPEYADYNVNITYYIDKASTKSVAEINGEVNKAVSNYVAWQCERLGRDINPSRLEAMVMETGVKRVVITSPTFVHLDSGDGSVPQVARVGTITITNGGYEDE